MKRTICMLFALLLALSLCACGDGGEGGGNVTTQPTEPAQSGATLAEEYCGVWYSNPYYMEDTIELHPDGTCVVYGEQRTYSVIQEDADYIVLDAQGIEISINLYEPGIPEIHLDGNWDFGYIQEQDYWPFMRGVWYAPNGDTIEVLCAGVAMPGGFYQEFVYNDDILGLEVMDGGQIICTIILLDTWNASVVDSEGNEVIYSLNEGAGGEPGGEVDPGQDEPMDEEIRLGLAYEKALNDFNAATSGQPVYDDEGNEITDGPALAQYLYDQFVALGDFEDASYYPPFFKTRTETVATEYRRMHTYWGDINENTFDHELPKYDVFGRLNDEDRLAMTYGINTGIAGTDYISLEYNENNVVTRVNVTTVKVIEQDSGSIRVEGRTVADLEYDSYGFLVASHVTTQDIDGNEIKYTSTFENDSEGKVVRINIPYAVVGGPATLTYLFLYDEDGRLLQFSGVYLPVDESVYYGYGRRPYSKFTQRNVYDESGLLTRMVFWNFYPDGPSYGEYTYSYDENGRLIEEVAYSYTFDWEAYRDKQGYTSQQVGAVQLEMQRALYHPDAYSADVLPEQWVCNDFVDLSEWNMIPRIDSIESESTYTYSETTIMYIDLTPED